MKKYPIRYRIFLGIALLHLSLMAAGASYCGYSFSGRLQPVLDYYGELSGAGNTYGFFAPGVTGQLRASFDVIDDKGAERSVSLSSGLSHEAELRVGNIIDQFAEDAYDAVELQRSLSSSLAGTIFGRYPEAAQVVVHLDKFTPISMADYRLGVRPRWESVYQARFSLNRERGAAK